MYLLKGMKQCRVSVQVVSGLHLLRGLMCTRSLHQPLYFRMRFPLSIHSFFVFYPFFAAWIDHHNQIIRTDVVFPFTFRISPPVGTTGLFEIPVHRKYQKIGAFLVGKRRFNFILSSRRTYI